MSVHCFLFIKEKILFKLRNDYCIELLTIFSELDKHTEPLDEDSIYINYSDDADFSYSYKTTMKKAKDRLDTMGFPLEKAVEDFKIGIHALQQELVNAVFKYSPEFQKTKVERIKFISSISLKDWIDVLYGYDRFNDFDELDKSFLQHVSYVYCSAGFGYPCSDVRYILRYSLEYFEQDDEIKLDYTEMVYGGEIEQDEPLAKQAAEWVKNNSKFSVKTIILTEGNIDSLILERSLKILYPHLTDFYSFMNFEKVNVAGGASELVRTVKAFAAASIHNNIIALFDNDTEGHYAIKQLENSKLSDNIRLLTLPDIEVAKDYPAIGPHGLSKMNVNGYACSIEMYLGANLLKNGCTGYFAIEWTSLNRPEQKYQGSFNSSDKKAILNSFKYICTQIEAGNKNIEEHDWSGIKMIFDCLFSAFVPSYLKSKPL